MTLPCVLRVPALPPRLAALAALVPPGRVVADIGSDHALLPVNLVAGRRIPWAIASDLSPGALARARAAVAAAGLSASIDLRQGAGLSVLQPGEAAVVVIAGLGGLTIADILDEGRAVAQRAELLLLQPMRHLAELRYRLRAGGFRLVEERLVQEAGRFYVVMAAAPGQMPAYSDVLMDIGPLLVARSDPLLRPYLKLRIARERRILRQVREEARSAAGRERARLAEKRVRAWEELLWR